MNFMEEFYKSLIKNMKKVDIRVEDKEHVMGTFLGVPRYYKEKRKGVSGKEAWGFIKDTITGTLGNNAVEELLVLEECQKKGDKYYLRLSATGFWTNYPVPHPAPYHSWEIEVKQKE
jgi:hypothetical protein